MNDARTIALILSIVGVTMLTGCEERSYERNAQMMEDAARSLIYPTPSNDPGNRAFMLEKIARAELVSGIASKVAVVFGCSDNRAACKQIADALMERSAALSKVHGRADTYDCNAID